MLAAGIVVCAFFYFLIFAQFALLKRIELFDAEKVWLQPAMLLMGLGGVSGALLTGSRFRTGEAKTWLLSGFFGCAFFALVAMWAKVVQVYLGVALGVGVFLGMLTVAVVPLLRLLIENVRIGLWSGIGVGLAYFLSNTPLVFNADPRVQCCLAAVGCGVGVLLVLGIGGIPVQQVQSGKFCATGYWGVVAVLFALVWLDSAAFYVIQETESLKASSWGESRQLWTNALAHLAAAVLSGWLVDREKTLLVMGGALGLLVGGCLCLKYGYGNSAGLGVFLYACGVSLYSTVLVAFCALGGSGQWSVARRAGVLFALAGWVASGMGIGMARDLNGVPVVFLIVALVFVSVVLFLLERSKQVEVAV